MCVVVLRKGQPRRIRGEIESEKAIAAGGEDVAMKASRPPMVKQVGFPYSFNNKCNRVSENGPIIFSPM